VSISLPDARSGPWVNPQAKTIDLSPNVRLGLRQLNLRPAWHPHLLWVPPVILSAAKNLTTISGRDPSLRSG
jgi:hypothetical protein